MFILHVNWLLIALDGDEDIASQTLLSEMDNMDCSQGKDAGVDFWYRALTEAPTASTTTICSPVSVSISLLWEKKKKHLKRTT